MSEWITDRRPIEHDEPYVYDSFGHVCHWIKIANGEPWKPIPPCDPYVKPKRWIASYSKQYHCWVLDQKPGGGFTILGALDKNDDQHREAAERIAAIYEEVMP